MAQPSIAIEAPRARRFTLETSSILMTVLLGVVAFLALAPLILTLISSFQLSPPGRAAVYGLNGWYRAFTDPSILKALENTLSLALVRQFIALALGIFLAWLVARTDLPHKGTLEMLFWISFFLPSLPVVMGWILLLDGKFGLINKALIDIGLLQSALFNIYSYWGIVFVHLAAGGIGVKVLLLAPAFRNLDAALEETSRSCGVSTLGTLWRIVIPIMMPAILVTTILGIIRSLEAFEIELLLGVPIQLFVYSTKIRELVVYEPPQYAPATALSSIFLFFLLAMVFLQRWYIGKRMYRTVSGKGFSMRDTPLGRLKWPIFSVVLFIALTVTIVPMIVLIMGTFMTAFGYFDIPRPWTMGNWQRVLADPLFLRSVKNTMVVGLGAALVGVVFYGLIAYTVTKTRYGARALLDFLSWLPWAIPGIVMGLALLWTVFQTRIFLPIYGTVYLLILAIVIKSMPVGVQLTKSVLLQLGDELEEASRISGGSWIHTYRRIVLPLLSPTLVTVGLLGFVSAARDISTIVLLGSSESRTLSLLALDFAYGGQFEKGTVVALITSVIVVVVAIVARMVGGKLGLRAA